jgi:hypothetical protein
MIDFFYPASNKIMLDKKDFFMESMHKKKKIKNNLKTKCKVFKKIQTK